MSETLEDLTYDLEDEGVLVRKQLERVVLTEGRSSGWPTVMFLFQELDRATGTFRAPKMAIVRFKKSRGAYRKQAAFNVSGEKQARQIAAVFDGWYARIQALAPAAADAEGDESADGDHGGDDDAHDLGAEG